MENRPHPNVEAQVEGEEASGDDAEVQGTSNQPVVPPRTPAIRMVITEQERNQARNIKQAIDSSSHINPVSDFVCVQLALVDGDNIESALERAHHLQCFREEYGILDSVEDGLHRFRGFFDLMPGSHICYATHQPSDQTVVIFDNTKFIGRRIRSERGAWIWLGSVYYYSTIFCPDFETIRQGVVFVFECEGYNWKQHADFNSIKLTWTEVANAYPMIISKFKFYNSTTMMNVVTSMMRPFMPRYVRQRTEMGCQIDVRMSDIYFSPTMEEAYTRNLWRMEDALQRRYENEKMFRL